MIIESLQLPTPLLYLIYFSVFFLGISIGSFMEVIRTREEWGLSISSRSFCVKCKKQLSFFELIPMLSFIFQKGKCKNCDCKIDINHFLSEILMGVLFLLVFIFSNSFLLIAIGIIASIFLVPIVLSDIEKFEVPEHISLPLAFISLALASFIFFDSQNIIHILNGIFLSLPFLLIYLLSSGRAMGLGDAKVAVSLGFLSTSFQDSFLVFLSTFWIGVIGIFIFVIWKKIKDSSYKLKRNTHIPLIPSMAMAFFLIFFLGDKIPILF